MGSAERANSIPNHVINPSTGMLESNGYVHAFDSERKAKFLELYKSNGLRLRRACRSMGLSEDTVNKHYKIDPIFKQALDSAEREYIEELEGVSRLNALEPKAVIERIFQLKCLLPDKYGQNEKSSPSKIVINVTSDLLEKAKKMEQIVDAQVISSTQNTELKSVENKQD